MHPEPITVTTMSEHAVIHQAIERLGGGVGRTDCWECGGDGDWTKFHPESETMPPLSLPCVDCKGTGKRLIMAY